MCLNSRKGNNSKTKRLPPLVHLSKYQQRSLWRRLTNQSQVEPEITESIRHPVLMFTELSLEDSLTDVNRRQLAATDHNRLKADLSTRRIVGLTFNLSVHNSDETCKINVLVKLKTKEPSGLVCLTLSWVCCFSLKAHCVIFCRI